MSITLNNTEGHGHIYYTHDVTDIENIHNQHHLKILNFHGLTIHIIFQAGKHVLEIQDSNITTQK